MFDVHVTFVQYNITQVRQESLASGVSDSQSLQSTPWASFFDPHLLLNDMELKPHRESRLVKKRPLYDSIAGLA